MELKLELEGLKEEVNEQLRVFLEEKNTKAKKDGVPDVFFETVHNVREFMLRGGKRLRPLLFFYGYSLAGGTDKEEALKTAISLEFLHTGLLIHDDVMDQDNVRHGGPSMHFKYEANYSLRLGRDDLQHFGYSMAICAGDTVLDWGYEALICNDFEDKLKIKAVALMSRIITETTIGQMLDESSQLGDDFDEKTVENIHSYKTARYTVVGPLQLGAIFAGAGEEELKFIADFATPLGVAYQIQDDILGVFGDMEKTGKPVGGDLREGKKTLLVSYAIKNAAEKDKNFLLSHLGNENLKEKDVVKIRDIMKRSGALKHSEGRIEELMQDFTDKLGKRGGRLGKRYALLKDLADCLLTRKK